MNKKFLYKKRKSYAVAFILLAAGILPLQSIISTAENTFDDTEYWALLVAVGVYADDPQQDRPDMLLEVDDLYALLLQSEWWQEDHIKVIKGEDATVTNIISGLRWLDRMEDKNDISVVYLTTHGFPLGIDIPPKDEADGTDEALVSYWGFAYEKLVIYDDELNVLLNRLESKGVCLIVDSCYAGGFNDPPNWLFTSTSPQSLHQNDLAVQNWVQGFGQDVLGQNRVVIMASCEDEVSFSGGFGPFLIDGLRGYADTNQDNIITAEEAFVYAEPRSPRQQPTIYDGYEGELPLMTLTTPLRSQTENTVALQTTPRNNEIPITPMMYNETSIICGYITDVATTDPIENANVNVRGRINDYEYYENQTTTNATGFYAISTPAIRLRVTVSAEGYCQRSVGPYQMQENQTRWTNISLYERPPETALIKGYITDKETTEPLEMANVSLFWQATEQQYYQNQTTSDTNGYYEINVAAGNISLDMEKQGYFTEYIQGFSIGDFETVWVNVSLYERPVENAIVCGYVTDEKTGEPLNHARIDVEWYDVTTGHEYGRETQSNDSGYYTIPIAPGELYVYVRETGYEYYDPYRHDAFENSTLWLNCSLTPSIIEVEITKPLKALYTNNERITPFKRTQIIGPIDVAAYIPGGWDEPGEAEKIEFYIDGVLQATVTTQPYNWTWTQKTIGKHIIKVVAYDYNGDIATKEIEVNKFL